MNVCDVASQTGWKKQQTTQIPANFQESEGRHNSSKLIQKERKQTLYERSWSNRFHKTGEARKNQSTTWQRLYIYIHTYIYIQICVNDNEKLVLVAMNNRMAFRFPKLQGWIASMAVQLGNVLVQLLHVTGTCLKLAQPCRNDINRMSQGMVKLTKSNEWM